MSFWGHLEGITSVILACTPSICIILARIYRRRRGDTPILLQDHDLVRGDNSNNNSPGNELAPVDRPIGLSGSTAEAKSKGPWPDRAVSKDRLDSAEVSACSTLHDEGPR